MVMKSSNVSSKDIKSLSDDELKSEFIKGGCKYVGGIREEVNRRISERCPRTSTKDKLEEIEKLCDGTYSFDRFLYNKPYSCMVGGKRVWFKSLDDMYYQLTKNDKYYKEQHKFYTESEWWMGYSHPTSYKDWLDDRGIKL